MTCGDSEQCSKSKVQRSITKQGQVPWRIVEQIYLSLILQFATVLQSTYPGLDTFLDDQSTTVHFFLGTAMKYSLITEPRASSDLCLFQDKWH